MQSSSLSSSHKVFIVSILFWTSWVFDFDSMCFSITASKFDNDSFNASSLSKRELDSESSSSTLRGTIPGLSDTLLQDAGGGRFGGRDIGDWLWEFEALVAEFNGKATRLFNIRFVGVIQEIRGGVKAHVGGSFHPGSWDDDKDFCVEDTSAPK